MRRKNNKYLILLGLLLLISVGYALISTTLKINGTANVAKQSWSVYWDEESISITPGSKGNTEPSVTNGENGSTNTQLSWSVDLEVPGDFYEFTIDAVNDGSMDAMITGITDTISPALPTNPAYITYSVAYADGTAIDENQLLLNHTREKIKVRVYYDPAVATAASVNAMTDEVAYSFTYNITYGQADYDVAEGLVKNLDDVAWSTVIANVEKNSKSYAVGSTKKVTINGSDYTFRVANNTTPAECSNPTFSQTACGFVMESVDLLDYYDFYSYNLDLENNYSTISNGFPNTRVYLTLRAEYSESPLISKFPSELQSAIIPTRVVSGIGTYNQSDFDDRIVYTTDKLFYPSVVEIYDKNGSIGSKSIAKDHMRQLDYYSSKGVTETSSTTVAKKGSSYNDRYNLRDYSIMHGNFPYVDNSGQLRNMNSTIQKFSISFRLGSNKKSSVSSYSCPGANCIYDHIPSNNYHIDKYYTNKQSSVYIYTTNVDEILDIGRNVFPGYNIDENGAIIGAYICINKNNNISCFDEVSDMDDYRATVDAIQAIFNNQCNEYGGTSLNCNVDNFSIWIHDTTDFSVDGTGSCWIRNDTKKIQCS